MDIYICLYIPIFCLRKTCLVQSLQLAGVRKDLEFNLEDQINEPTVRLLIGECSAVRNLSVGTLYAGTMKKKQISQFQEYSIGKLSLDTVATYASW